ncbi:hypothetical protein [Colwellia psychrerythraea]|uniref:von Hippel-Lindau disease tumour suppressor beta domain-containing protein n=1 Tax=Colwellia psychrerythraea TaxID=28229 RepID=A0A099KYS4_COLPS|nr:hypothetical protein [Colwellia psychrerythraea]KGJ94798.1 hypothetical protein GAB14E_2032 [Colwellia psychrerythraea]
MSKKLLNALLVTSTCFVSQQAFAQTCFMESSTTGGPTGPATCVAISVIEQEHNSVNLAVSAIRLGSDISNYFNWHSNIDGALGYGDKITAELSQGNHTITAVAEIPHMRPYFDTLALTIAQEANNCADESASIAETYDEYYALNFINTAAEPVNVYWLKYQDAERVLYGTLAQDESISLTGYPGNKWVVTDENNTCQSIHYSGYANENVELN